MIIKGEVVDEKNILYNISIDSTTAQYTVESIPCMDDYRIYKLCKDNEKTLLNAFSDLYQCIKFIKKEVKRVLEDEAYVPKWFTIYKTDKDMLCYTSYNNRFLICETLTNRMCLLYDMNCPTPTVPMTFLSVKACEEYLENQDLIIPEVIS